MILLREIIAIPSLIVNKINICRKHVKCGANLRIRGVLSLHGSGRIIFGDNVNIISTPFANPIGGNQRTFLQAEHGGEIIIHNNVGMTAPAITAYKKVVIEDNVLLGRSVCIYDTDFHSLDYTIRVHCGKEGAICKDVCIHEGAFIGAHSIILKGVSIGRHSIIGAGSVVTKDVPDNEIWAGNPARFIKKIEE